jgi:hypothetical protein
MRSRPWLRTVALVLGTAVVVTAAPALARTVVDFARNAGHLDGYRARQFAFACGSGTIGGYAQVPGDLGSAWTSVDGYGLYQISFGAQRGKGGPPCKVDQALASQVSPGVYLVSLNSALAGDCQFASYPRPGDPLPAVVTPASSANVTAAYTTECDPNDKGFVERVTIRAPDGTPAAAGFTLETLHPVQVFQP